MYTYTSRTTTDSPPLRRPRDLKRAICLVIAAVIVLIAGPLPMAHAASSPPDTLDRAALGTGGGPFCDALRTNLIDSSSMNLAAAITSDDTVKLKAYYEKSAALIPKLIGLAPPEIATDTKVAMQFSMRMVTALKSVNYDFRKLDRKMMATVSQMSPTERASEAKLNTYMIKSCHIDVAKLFGVTPPPPSVTTAKKKTP